VRQPGFYWVRVTYRRSPEVASWDGDAWYVCGYDLPVDVEVLSELLSPAPYVEMLSKSLSPAT
jgi:hypothetical protein